MATMSGVSLSSPRLVPMASQKSYTAKFPLQFTQRCPAKFASSGRIMTYVGPVRAAPDRISDKVEESIKSAQEACSDDPAGSECVAAWDEVEELSAAASHARDRKKESDPLEDYCKDNPETNECRTYDN